MTIDSWSELSAEQEAELQAEGTRLLEFLAPDTEGRGLLRVELGDGGAWSGRRLDRGDVTRAPRTSGGPS